MRYGELITELERKRFSNLYLFYGEEAYLIEDVLRRVSEAIIHAKDFNYDLLYGSSSSADEILGIAQTLPVFSPWRLLIVKEADKILDKDLERLLPYINDPSPSTCLIFVGEKIDMRKRFFSTLKEKATVVEFRPLFEGELNSWIKNKVRDSGLTIIDGAIEILKEEVGGELWALDNEIRKLSLYATHKDYIDEGDVLKVVGNLKIFTIFNLTEEIGQKRTENAIRTLRRLIKEGEAPPKILVMIARQMRLLLRSVELKEAGFRKEEIRKRIGIAPRFFNLLWDQIPKHNLEGLRHTFKRMQKADLEIKTSPGGKERILEALILDLCR